MTAHLARSARPEPTLERIHRHHVGLVYRYALAMLREPDDAEHVTRATFLSANGALRDGAHPRAADLWLIGIAHGLCRKRGGYAESVLDELARTDRAEVTEPATCPRAETAILRALDGELSLQSRATLRAHLRTCRSCRALVRRQRGQRAAIRALRTVPLPPSLVAVGASILSGRLLLD